jgi:hypothetical protein
MASRGSAIKNTGRGSFRGGSIPKSVTSQAGVYRHDRASAFGPIRGNGVGTNKTSANPSGNNHASGAGKS